MNLGKTLFSQVMAFLPRKSFQAAEIISARVRWLLCHAFNCSDRMFARPRFEWQSYLDNSDFVDCEVA